MNSRPANESSPQKTYRLMAGVAIAMVFLLSVAIYSLSRLTSAPWTSPLRVPDLTAQPGKGAPDFKITSEGKTFTAADFDEQWTLVSFWSFTCPPCLEELPALNALDQDWSGPELNVLTVNLDTGADLAAARKYLVDTEIALTTIFDEAGVLKKAFGVEEYPRHFMIDPKRQIVWSASGAFKWSDGKTRDQLLKLMAQSPEPE